nr:zinc ribbon domain-containing protein [Staphylothermus hellenicus]
MLILGILRKQCPIHKSPIIYSNGSRIGRCSTGGELWHRDIVACYNILSRTLGVDGSYAPRPMGVYCRWEARAVGLDSHP